MFQIYLFLMPYLGRLIIWDFSNQATLDTKALWLVHSRHIFDKKKEFSWAEVARGTERECFLEEHDFVLFLTVACWTCWTAFVSKELFVCTRHLVAAHGRVRHHDFIPREWGGAGSPPLRVFWVLGSRGSSLSHRQVFGETELQNLVILTFFHLLCWKRKQC